MPCLSPPTLTAAEQKALLHATTGHPRDNTIFSVALGTGLRLGEIVGLTVGDLYFPDGTPRTRVHLRREIAKGGRAGDVFVPDALGKSGCQAYRSPSAVQRRETAKTSSCPSPQFIRDDWHSITSILSTRAGLGAARRESVDKHGGWYDSPSQRGAT